MQGKIKGFANVLKITPILDSKATFMNAYMTFIQTSIIFGFNIFYSYQLKNEKSPRLNLKLVRKNTLYKEYKKYSLLTELDTAE